MKKNKFLKERHLGGKDWDKFIACEGCGKRPTACECKNHYFYEIIIALAIVIVVTLLVLANI